MNSAIAPDGQERFKRRDRISIGGERNLLREKEACRCFRSERFRVIGRKGRQRVREDGTNLNEAERELKREEENSESPVCAQKNPQTQPAEGTGAARMSQKRAGRPG